MDVDEVIKLVGDDLGKAIEALSPPFTGQVTIAEGWPAEAFLLQNVAAKGAVSISIFDRGPAKNMTRWSPFVAVEFPHETGITAELSDTVLPDGDTVTLTLGGVVKQNDAVALTGFLRGPIVNHGAVAIAGPTVVETPQDMAAKLSTAINADPDLSQWMTASVVGAVITLEGINGAPVKLRVAVGNIRIQIVENARFMRELQVVVWAGTPVARGIIGKAISEELAQVYVDFGLKNAIGEWVRIIPFGDLLNDNDATRALYRRDFLVNAEYGITAQQVAYDILSPRPSLTVEQGA